MGVIVPTECADAEDGRRVRREAERRVGVNEGEELAGDGVFDAYDMYRGRPVMYDGSRDSARSK